MYSNQKELGYRNRISANCRFGLCSLQELGYTKRNSPDLSFGLRTSLNYNRHNPGRRIGPTNVRRSQLANLAAAAYDAIWFPSSGRSAVRHISFVGLCALPLGDSPRPSGCGPPYNRPCVLLNAKSIGVFPWTFKIASHHGQSGRAKSGGWTDMAGSTGLVRCKRGYIMNLNTFHFEKLEIRAPFSVKTPPLIEPKLRYL